ncbi:MFS transporter [Eggerthella sp. YY7918]|uniref:MFS transporter n=1 Tax=Eggerthella sp. (strain YY7918) TaxID=502558 RepID=UPI00021715FF|nr:MFS transporter [Eggerthella sp. YY7918]BAK44959.1 hypothetical protein EGYY_18240 [Eggerthella sp. YY7918]
MQSKEKIPLKITIALFIYGGATVALFTNTPGFFYAPVSEYLGIGRGEFSLYYTAQAAVTFVFLLFSGKIINKYHEKLKLILIAAIVSQFIGYGFFANGTALWHWYVGAVFVGAGNAFDAHLLIGILVNNWFKLKGGTILGLVFAFVSVVGAVVSPLVSTLIAVQGFRVAYACIGVCSLVLVLPTVLFLIKYQPQDCGMRPYGEATLEERGVDNLKTSENGGISHAVALKSSSFYLLYFFTYAICCWASFNFAMPGYAASVGFDAVHVGLASTCVMVGGIIGKLSLGVLTDKAGVCRATLIISLLGIIGMLLLVLSPSAPLFFVGAIFFGLALSLTGVMSPAATRDVFGSKDYDTIYSNIATSTWLGTATAIPLYNFVFDFTGSYASGMIAAIVLLVAGFVCLVASKKIASRLPWQRMPFS